MSPTEYQMVMALMSHHDTHVQEWRDLITRRLIAIEDRLELIVLILQGTTHQGVDFDLDGDTEPEGP